jgi:hypothetical protein
LNYLLNLVGLGFTFAVLNIDTRIARPRSLKNGVTATRLPGFADVKLAYFFSSQEIVRSLARGASVPAVLQYS